MKIEFFTIPIDLSYSAILEIPYRADYIATLHQNWWNGRTYVLTNYQRLTPQMQVSTSLDALYSTYCLIGDEVDNDGKLTDGDFYFIRNAQQVAYNACVADLVTDLYHNYIKRDFFPPYINRGVMSRGHFAVDMPAQYAPFSLPAPVDPPAYTEFKSLLTENNTIPTLDDYVFRVVASANFYTDPARPPTHMVSEALPLRTCASLIAQLFDLGPLYESETGAPTEANPAVSIPVVSYSYIGIVPATLITRPNLIGKWYSTLGPTSVGEFWTVNEAAYKTMHLRREIVLNDEIAFDLGDVVAFGTTSHILSVPTNGKRIEAAFVSTYNMADGFRFAIDYAGETIDITKDFSVPIAAKQASSYYTTSQNEQDISRGILGVLSASVAVGGTIASGGSLAPVLLPTAVGAIGDLAAIGVSRWQTAKMPYSVTGTGGGFDNAIRGGLIYIAEPASNKTDIQALIDERGLEFTKRIFREYFTIPHNVRGYTYVEFEDIDLNIAAPSEIREQCNRIFVHGTTIYTDPTKLVKL